jgi:hypothetical protein
MHVFVMQSHVKLNLNIAGIELNTKASVMCNVASRET